MLVTFRSSATETITMFEDVAVSLLKLMGATGRVPGGFSPDDVPAALKRLEAAVERMKAESHATEAPPANNEDSADDESERDAQPPVALATRAIPLLSLMKRAAAANAELVWESK
jgi:Domain of unknown function (DUF1840)